jgi:hypothetical protein
MLIFILLSNVCFSEQSVVFPLDKQPLWVANPNTLRIVEDSPSYVEIVGSNEFCQEVKIPAFQQLQLEWRIPVGKSGRIYLKLLEGGGAEYITPTVDLKGTGKWETVGFALSDLSIAPWSDDDNYYLDFPFPRVYLVFVADKEVTLHLKALRTAGTDPRKPAVEYPLVNDWIQRLASQQKPEIPTSFGSGASSPLVFYEGDETITLKATGYELMLDKHSGKLLKMKFSGDLDAWKPADGKWWSLVTFDGDIVSNTQATSFKYVWDKARKRFSAVYTFENQVESVIAISGTVDSLRCKIFVKNLSMSPIRCLRFPDSFSVDTSRLSSMILPRLGGVELLPGYFKTARRLAMDYPSDAMSDFIWVGMATGPVSIYTVQDEKYFWSSRLKLWSNPNQSLAQYSRDTNTFIGAGNAWVSPTIVFLSGSSPIEAFGRYWVENGLDKSKTLYSKLGETLFERLSTSVLLKYDFDFVAPKTGDRSKVFSNLTAELDNLPSPVMLHLVDYWNPPETNRRPDGGVFDTNYPEFLPPREEFGGTVAFKGFLGAARWRGLPIMPYTNPTCWGKESASYRQFGDEVAARNLDGSVAMGWGMVTVTPTHPQVIAKNRANLEGFTGEFKVDLLFEDQVGARSHCYDFSPYAIHPAGYIQGLISHAKEASAKIPLMTERGFDHLVPYESGFCGIELGLSCTRHMPGWEWDAYYGKGNWRVFPFDTLFVSPYAALYHHDLGQFVLTKGDISWCLAKGYNMTYPYGFPRNQLEVCDAFQKAVCSRYFGVKAKSFEYLNENVTKTVFPKVTIYANHSPDTTFDHDKFTLAKEGCLALDENGELIAGILTRMNGVDLHREVYVFQTTDPNRIQIRCLVSPDGPVAVRRPRQWTDVTRIRVLAVTYTEQLPVEFETTDEYIKFQYLSSIDGKAVTRYTVVYAAE